MPNESSITHRWFLLIIRPTSWPACTNPIHVCWTHSCYRFILLYPASAKWKTRLESTCPDKNNCQLFLVRYAFAQALGNVQFWERRRGQKDRLPRNTFKNFQGYFLRVHAASSFIYVLSLPNSWLWVTSSVHKLAFLIQLHSSQHSGKDWKASQRSTNNVSMRRNSLHV